MSSYFRQASFFLDLVAKRLKFFRFVQGTGGHANEPDELYLKLQASPLFELAEFLTAFGQSGADLIDQCKQPANGRVMHIGEISVFNEKVYAEFFESNLIVTLGTSWEVTEGDIEKGENIELQLAPFRHLIIDPPVDSPRCLCPKYYPELFK